jgi:pimeloyl-ACP methyl ester carboxylesterase
MKHFNCSPPTGRLIWWASRSGTGVAAYLAGTHPDQVAGVVLFAPYNRLADAAQYHYPILPVHLLLVDRFPSEDYLRNYHGPVGVLVAGEDQVVPEKFGRRLYDGYAGPKRFGNFHWTTMDRSWNDCRMSGNKSSLFGRSSPESP